ncbi:unnamed protein product [Heterosigma akashiwo]
MTTPMEELGLNKHSCSVILNALMMERKRQRIPTGGRTGATTPTLHGRPLKPCSGSSTATFWLSRLQCLTPPQFAIDDVCAIFQVEVDPGERGGATALGPLPPPRGPCRVAVLLSRPPRGSHKDCWLINAVYDEECHLPAGEGLSGAPPPAV